MAKITPMYNFRKVKTEDGWDLIIDGVMTSINKAVAPTMAFECHLLMRISNEYEMYICEWVNDYPNVEHYRDSYLDFYSDIKKEARRRGWTFSR